VKFIKLAMLKLFKNVKKGLPTEEVWKIRKANVSQPMTVWKIRKANVSQQMSVWKIRKANVSQQTKFGR